jgi:outer membrane protein OmpA-like peptidoglycan-associated protein
MGRRIESLRAFALAAAIVALAACTTPHPRPPVARPPVMPTKPVARPPVKSARPVVPVAPAGIVTVRTPPSYEQEKSRTKSALATNIGESLAASDVGYYMDVLQGRLKQVSGKNIGIVRQGDRIVLNLSGRSGFDAGSTQINAGIRDTLGPVTKVLVEYRKTLVSVQTHADGVGAPAVNPQLAEQRAQALARYLADAGVSDKRIVAAGAGAETRARIELQLEPVVHAADSAH